LRVISGEYRSRKLVEVNSDKTRETKDRVKESIFNSINSDCFDAKVLDLFAGSGSLGIEALSRGAKECTFVDHANEAMKALRENIDNLNIQSSSLIHQTSYQAFLENAYEPYDIILLDPPYKLEIIDDIIKDIARKQLLSPSGVILCLYGKGSKLKEENNGVIEYKKKTIGITNVSFMKWGI
jgi:16S rRNA (guanine(966)-N(2))-methyltransferase RsmD